NAAIQRGAPGTFVFAVNDDRSVSVKPVKVGPTQGETSAIDSGIGPGTLVVVDGADKLREGSKVELVTREAQASGPAADARKTGPRGDRPRGEGARKKSE